jgi:hypothetical protein
VDGFYSITKFNQPTNQPILIMSIKQLFLAATMFAATTAATAQDYPQNVVKLGLEPAMSFVIDAAFKIPAFPQANLYYERMISPRQSANIMLGIGIPSNMSETNVAYFNTVGTSTATTANSSDVKLKSGSTSSFEAVAEYRFYLSDQEGPRGFYLGPQLYYKNFNATVKGSHLPTGITNPQPSTDEIQINYTMIDLGVQTGVQWLINDKISIDWLILGIGGGVNTASVSGNTSDKASVAKWAKDLKDGIDGNKDAKGFGILTDKITSDVATGKISLSTPVFPVYFRTGLAIGYAF